MTQKTKDMKFEKVVEWEERKFIKRKVDFGDLILFVFGALFMLLLFRFWLGLILLTIWWIIAKLLSKRRKVYFKVGGMRITK